nr:RNA-directed DNA polymerase, eukaryota [Tanacetum cinerariifolium]
MESLHLSFQRVVDAGIFKGIKLSSSLSISHMFYANDAVFVGQWCDGNITTLVHVLECFYRASGLRINMSKSKIMGVLVDNDKVHTWNEVVDRVKNRLSKWKMKTLSIGVKGQELNSKKASWVNWKKVLAPKEKGGLGVSSLYALNREGIDVVGMHAEESKSDNIVNLSDHNAEEVNNTFSGNCPKKNSKEEVSNSVCSGHFKTSMVPRTNGSIMSLMDELVKVGQVMRYKMDGCMSNMTEIIESRGVKEMLWDYLTYEIGTWKWDVVIMGDFNEVRYKSDRFGSMFNVQGANVFNSFITNAGLEEVPLGGSSFTWCHKSATRMSKLDRFLIYENLLNTCPNITAIT